MKINNSEKEGNLRECATVMYVNISKHRGNEERRIKARQFWIDSYLKLGSVSKAARRCGIPRSTLYRWISRFEKEGENGLNGRSKRPKILAKEKITFEQESLILPIRKTIAHDVVLNGGKSSDRLLCCDGTTHDN